jgi:hypothetical protein
MTDVADSLLGVFDYAFERLHGRLGGLSDDEYFWEPVSGCWSLRQDDSGHWRLDGDGGGGRRAAPEPAPFTTIAWRMGHVSVVALGGFTDRRFPELAFGELDLPAHPGEAIDVLERCYSRWRQGMESLSAEAWEEPLGSAWGPYADDTTIDLALHVLDELVHHGAEIALLRDLYRHRGELA